MRQSTRRSFAAIPPVCAAFAWRGFPTADAEATFNQSQPAFGSADGHCFTQPAPCLNWDELAGLDHFAVTNKAIGSKDIDCDNYFSQPLYCSTQLPLLWDYALLTKVNAIALVEGFISSRWLAF